MSLARTAAVRALALQRAAARPAAARFMATGTVSIVEKEEDADYVLYVPTTFSDCLEWVLETPTRQHEFAESPVIVESTSNDGCHYLNPEH